MAKSIEDLYKEIIALKKELGQNDTKKDILDLKKTIKNMDNKINDILEKVQEFEIIMDAAEILEEHMEEEENKFNSEWSPYDDDCESEEYEDYGNSSEDDDE